MKSAARNYNVTKTLLIVDDDKLILNMLSDFFREHGYAVIKAKDGEEAVKTYIKNADKIDLVLMDIVMPYKDGLTASVEIKEYNPEAIVCFMSGYTPELIDTVAKENYIKKPFLPSEVIKVVREHLDGHVY